jgi:hypothetical protein
MPIGVSGVAGRRGTDASVSGLNRGLERQSVAGRRFPVDRPGVQAQALARGIRSDDVDVDRCGCP